MHGEGYNLESERNNPWFKPWFNILLHAQSIVCATVYGQRLEYLGYITLAVSSIQLGPTLLSRHYFKEP